MKEQISRLRASLIDGSVEEAPPTKPVDLSEELVPVIAEKPRLYFGIYGPMDDYFPEPTQKVVVGFMKASDQEKAT